MAVQASDARLISTRRLATCQVKVRRQTSSPVLACRGMHVAQFDLNEVWSVVGSDEATIGGRETREMTIREVAVIMLATIRSN